MNDDTRNDGRAFRVLLGLAVMLLAGCGFGALFFIKVPPENKDAMMFALGNVFGWAASVVSSEYGATTTGRKVAESAIRSIERQTPSGTVDDPLHAKVDNPPDDPANVTEPKP